MQTSGTPSSQTLADWFPSAQWAVLAGVILPVACFLFDPIVLHASVGTPLIGSAWLRVFLVVQYLCTSIALVWALVLRRVDQGSAAAAGLLAAGALGAALLGLVLLPMSVIGLAAFIGLLGFSPFLSAHAYHAVSRQTYRGASLQRTRIGGRAIVAFALGLAVPAVVGVCVAGRAERALMQMVSAPTPSLHVELTWYQRLFGLESTAVEVLQRLPPEQREPFEQACGTIGVKPLWRD